MWVLILNTIIHEQWLGGSIFDKVYMVQFSQITPILRNEYAAD